MNTNTALMNPSVMFYRTYKQNIQRARETLFADLNSTSPDFAKEARKLLEEKLSSNQNKPLLGELFPWIIKDLVKANTKTTHKISVAWLAIYLYTLFLDDYVDNPKPLTATGFITGSLLVKTGLLKLSKLTNNTPYEKMINRAVSLSAYNQDLDVKFQKKILPTNLKIEYSKGKNNIIFACAGALAAQNSKHAKFITEFTNKLLLTLQYLDDIADYKEDFKNRNITVLLNYAFQKGELSKLASKNVTDRKLLMELVRTGALQRVLQKIQVLLNQSILLIQEQKPSHGQIGNSVHFFVSIYTHISAFNKFLKEHGRNFDQLPWAEQKIILDETEKFIPLIAQST